MSDLLSQIKAASDFLRPFLKTVPKAGIILGSGLGNLASEIEDRQEIPYGQIPHFPPSTVEGHSGTLILGTLGGQYVIAMAGRYHYYEGYTMQQVTFPVRVMRALGVETLVISNAAGGMNPAFSVGDLMIITDHINLQPEHPLHGKNIPELGPRFPDMSEAYSQQLVKTAQAIADRHHIFVHTGVYVGVQGPTFETRAEYRYMHIIGGDAVGMSTVPEVIVAVHGGMKVFAMSVITDVGIVPEGQENKVSHEEVLAAAKAAEPKLTTIIRELIQQI